ncbi:MAG: hypothetical protein HC890_16155, partial [Chloroflexaceae bacterium]|nr:hypothetical protein [Chloroflexaceae bacterium]
MVNNGSATLSPAAAAADSTARSPRSMISVKWLNYLKKRAGSLGFYARKRDSWLVAPCSLTV